MRIFCLVILFLFTSLQAQEATLEVYPPYPMKGDAVSLVLKADAPIQMVDDFPVIENWRMGSGIRRGSQTVNGVSSYYFIKQYMPEKEGEFTIPSINIRLNGKLSKTPEKKIKVLPNKAAKDSDKIIITSIKYNGQDSLPEKIYPGVFFTIDYEVSVARGWRYLDHDALYDYRPRIQAKDLQIQTYNSFLENRNFDEITDHKLIDGIPYTTKIYRYKLSPIKSGTYDVNITQRVFALKKIPGIPRNKTKEKQVNIQETLTVSPLPPAPPGVYSLEIAGNWKVSGKLSKSEAKTGHTFELHLYIQGKNGDIERVKAPELNLPGFEVDPKPEIQHHNLGAIIKYSMRALKKAPFPKLTFATFNHINEKFELHKVNLDIEISGEDILVEPDKAKNSLQNDNPENKKPGLKIGKNSITRPLYFNISPLWYLISLALPLLYLSIVWFFRRAEMGQELDTKKEAVDKLKTLCTKLESSSDSEFFDKQLLPYLAQAYELPPGVTADELVKKIDDKELAALIQNSSHQSFLPGNQRQQNNSALAAKLKKSLLTLMIFFLSSSVFGKDEMIIKSYENGDYYATVDGYEQLINEDNSNPNYFYNLGLAQLNLERYPEALASLETALRLQPLDADIRNKVIFTRNKLQVQKPNDLFSVRDKLRPDQWLKASMMIWAVLWIILIVQLIKKVPGKRWTATCGGIITFFCLLAYFTQMSSTYKEGQFIITEEISIAENDMTPGEEVFVLEENDGKAKIHFKGKDIWIEKNKLAKVW